MAVLSAQSIKRIGVLEPVVDAGKDSRGCSYGLSCCGYDITLDQDVMLFPAPWQAIFMCMVAAVISTAMFQAGHIYIGFVGVAAMVVEGLIALRAQTFVLASAREKFDLPYDVMGIVHDKSSIARQGVAVQNTVLEPGWSGYLTLELNNHGSKLMRFKKGDAIAQVVFHRLDEITDRPYTGKYQNQERGPQEAR